MSLREHARAPQAEPAAANEPAAAPGHTPRRPTTVARATSADPPPPSGPLGFADALTAGVRAGGVIRRAPLAITPAAPEHLAPAIAAARQAAGRPLDAEPRRRLEASYGVALDDVRIHDGPEAAAAASALAARAFTQGSAIYFGAGAYDPSSAAGFELLAHEVAHTRQGAGDGALVGGADHHDEHAADTAAASAVRGESAPLAGARSTGGVVRRRPMRGVGVTALGTVQLGGARPRVLQLEARGELTPPGAGPAGFDGYAALDQAVARAAQSPHIAVVVVDPDRRYHVFSTGLAPQPARDPDDSPVPFRESLISRPGIYEAVRIVRLYDEPGPAARPAAPRRDALSVRAAEREGDAAPDDRDRQPWQHGRETEQALANLQHGHAAPLDRARLAGAIAEQVPDVALMREIERGARAVVTLIMPGTGRLSVKNMNDHLVGYEINANRVVRPMQTAIDQAFGATFQPIDRSYKSSTYTSREDAAASAARVPSLLPRVDAEARTILAGAFREAIAYWRGRSEQRVHELEAVLPTVDRSGFQYPLTHGTAPIERRGAAPAYADALAARMHATEAALMSRSVDEPAPGAARGQSYDRAAFVRFAQEAEALRGQIRATNRLTYGGTSHAVLISVAGHEQLNTEVVQDFRRGRIVAPVERETFEQFRRYMHHINAFDYLKDFRGDETAAVGGRIAQARAAIAQLEGGARVDPGVVADLVHRNAATGQIDPQADTASAGVFYEAARQRHDRIVVRADIRGLGADLAQGYARATTATAQPGADLDTIARGANDGVVDVRRRATAAMRRAYAEMWAAAIAQARSRRDATAVHDLEAERSPVFLLGGDEITMSLHHALQDQVPMLIAALQHPDGANARVGISHTPTAPAAAHGCADTTDTTDAHLTAFRQADETQARVKYYEDRQLAMQRRITRITDERRRRAAAAQIAALRIDYLYGEYDGGVILRDRETGARHDDAELQREVDRVENNLPVVDNPVIRPVETIEDLPTGLRRPGEL